MGCAGGPCQPRDLGLAADVAQRPCARAVSIKGEFMELNERGRRGGYPDDPCRPHGASRAGGRPDQTPIVRASSGVE